MSDDPERVTVADSSETVDEMSDIPESTSTVLGDSEAEAKSLIDDLGKLLASSDSSGASAGQASSRAQLGLTHDSKERHDLQEQSPDLSHQVGQDLKDVEQEMPQEAPDMQESTESPPEVSGSAEETELSVQEEAEHGLQDETQGVDESTENAQDEESKYMEEIEQNLQEEAQDVEASEHRLQEEAQDVEASEHRLQEEAQGGEASEHRLQEESSHNPTDEVQDLENSVEEVEAEDLKNFGENQPEAAHELEQHEESVEQEQQEPLQDEIHEATQHFALESRPEVQKKLQNQVHNKPGETAPELQQAVQEPSPVVAQSRSELQEELSISEDSRPNDQDATDTATVNDNGVHVSSPEANDQQSEEPQEEFVDILGTGQLLKKTLVKGKGEATRPKNACRVTVSYEARLDGESGELVDSQQDLCLTIGDFDFVQAFDIALMLVELGERCQIVSGPQFSYGSKLPHTSQLGRVIPPGSTLTYTVELTRVDEPLDLSTIGLNELLAMADAKRERGNFWFNRDDYHTAVCCYARSAAVLEQHCSGDMSGAPDATVQAVLDARVRVYNNLAACQLKLESWDAVIESCDKALRLQSGSAKALYRKGRALSSKGDHQAALRVLQAGLRNDPESRALQSEVARVTLECQRQATASKELYRRMMGGGASSRSPGEAGGPGAAAAAATSSATGPASAGADESTLFGRYKYWMVGALGALLVSGLLAGAVYRNNR